MAETGVVVNVRGALPSRDELVQLGCGPSGFRSIAYRFDEVREALLTLPPRMPVCILANSETEGVGQDFKGWEKACHELAWIAADDIERRATPLFIVECANELDLLGVPATAGMPDRHSLQVHRELVLAHQAVMPRHRIVASSRRLLTTGSAADLVRRASPILRASGVKVAMTSVAGPNWIDYLTQLARACAGYADFACLHPYGQRAAGFPEGWGFGELSDAISTANSVSGLPVLLSEFGIKVGDAGGPEGQAEYVRRAVGLLKAHSLARVPMAYYFAWRDDVGSPNERGDQAFGLEHTNGVKRPAWQAFATAQGSLLPPVEPEPGPVVPFFQAGFATWASREPLLLGAPRKLERGSPSGFRSFRR
jgi:hypothetical protein